MRWPWQRSSGRHAAVPVQRRATWAQPAMPPPIASVRLGFSDGSEQILSRSDPYGAALLTLADRLMAG